MAMRFTRLMAAIGFLLISGSPALAADGAADCDLLLDASGSMRGFLIHDEFTNLLRAATALCPRVFLFGDRLRQASGPIRADTFDDQHTNLGPDIQDWLALAPGDRSLVVVTDNVADDSVNGAGGSQRAFYDILQRDDSPFSRVAIILLRLQFGGQVYSPTNHHTRYDGPRALSIYVLQRGNGPSLLRGLAGNLSANGWIEDRVDATKERSFSAISLAPFEGLEGLSSSGPQAGTSLSLGTNPDEVTFDSRGHIVIDAGMSDKPTHDFAIPVTLTKPSDWDIGANAVQRYHAGIEFLGDAMEPSGQAVACAVSGGGPSTKDSIPLRISCSVLSPWARLPEQRREQLSALGATHRSGVLAITLALERSNIALVGPLKLAWSWDRDPEELGRNNRDAQMRIYQLNDLIQGMVRPKSVVPVGNLFPVEVDYTHNGLLAIFAFLRDNIVSIWIGCAFIAVLGCFLFLLTFRPRFRVVGEREENRVRTFGFLQITQLQSRGGRHTLTVTPLGAFLVMTSATGRPSTYVLPIGGGEVAVRNPGSQGAAAVFSFRRQRNRSGLASTFSRGAPPSLGGRPPGGGTTGGGTRR
jgi:hypothetical protein